MYGLACLLLVLLLFTTTVNAAVVDETLKLTRMMTLNCVYPGSSRIEQATWSRRRGSQKEVIAVFSREHGAIIHKPYTGRVDFVKTASDSNDKSLFFNWTLSADVGLHSCSVQAFPEGSWEKKIMVSQADYFEETAPLLSSSTAALGHNTTMTCQSTLGSVVQQLTWEKIGTGKQITIAWCNLSNGQVMQGYGSDYKYRSHIDCDSLQNSSLTIWNINASDEGLYHCHVATDAGNQTTVISLGISGGHSAYKVSFLIIGGAALVIVLVFTVAIIVGVRCMHKKKKARERNRRMVKSNVLHPNQTRPANSYGRGHSGADHRCGRPKRHGAAATAMQAESIYVNCQDLS